MNEDDPADRLSEMAGPPPPPPPPQPVVPLDYNRRGAIDPSQRPPDSPGLQFAIAFFAGIGLTTIAWYTGDHPGAHTGSLFWIYLVLSIKFAGGITLACFRRTRPIGAGLFSSLAVGCMIFGAGWLNQCGISNSGG